MRIIIKREILYSLPFTILRYVILKNLKEKKSFFSSLLIKKITKKTEMYLDFIMHVRNIICVQFINDNLVRQLDLIEAKMDK